ncbi:MAG: response regulator [Gammaproteobacteria bacterium]|nr:response regulator [Gammaproteobacteria bacterium]
MEKSVEFQTEITDAKSKLLITIGHELRTPIAGILGMIRMLNKLSMPVQAKEYIYDIKMAAEHVLSLVNDLLDTAKIESGSMELACVPFNLKYLIEEALSILSYQTSQKKLKLIRFFSDDLPEHVKGDERAIKQIIINLVGNAIKFTEQGEVGFAISVFELQPHSVLIKMEVTDTGVGISEDKLAFIFDQFSHADNSYARQQGGTGLGLALCKNYLDLMGGSITAQSRLGKGSTFCCMIPFELPQDSFLPPQQSVELDPRLLQAFCPERREENTILKVLLVEDNLVIKKVHLALLQELGCCVDVLDRGELVLNRLKQGEQYDIIFMDIGLPDCAGTTVAEMIRQWEQRQGMPAVPLIAMTAYLQQEEHTRCFDAGMDAVITKPVEMSELRCILKNFSDKKTN